MAAKDTPKPSPRKGYHHGDLASALLRAAEKELSENGMEAFSLRAVAKRAGVSHGAPAHHFGDVRGLLTALATQGYQRLIKAQNTRQRKAKPDPKSQLAASGLGYIDFAIKNPALFRLMFSSEKPDRTDDRFFDVALEVFNKLVSDTQKVSGKDPYRDRETMKELMASWSIVHGLAELMISGRAERPMGFDKMTKAERDAVIIDIIQRTN